MKTDESVLLKTLDHNNLRSLISQNDNGEKTGEWMMGKMEGRTKAISGDFNSQAVANKLWAFATMERKQGERK